MTKAGTFAPGKPLLHNSDGGPRSLSLLSLAGLRRARVGALVGVGFRKVDIRLHGKGNSDPHGARPVY